MRAGQLVMTATIAQRRELAAVIARQATAIADGTSTGPAYSAAHRLLANAEMLAAWTPDDRARPGRPAQREKKEAIQ